MRSSRDIRFIPAAFVLVTAVALGGCTKGKPSADGPPKGGDAVTTTVLAVDDAVEDELDGVVESVDPAAEYDENVSPLAVRDPSVTDEEAAADLAASSGGVPVDIGPTTTATLPPLPRSRAEIEALEVPATSRPGSIDNDAAAAAPDTRPLIAQTLPTQASVVTTTLPPPTVPDLGLDPARAEAIIGRVVWPTAFKPEPVQDIDAAGNAVANVFAKDARLRAALRSGASRLALIEGENSIRAFVSAVIVVDPSSLGPSLTDELTSTFRASGAPQVTSIGQRPAVVVDLENGVRQYAVAVGNDRIVAVGGAIGDDQQLRDLLALLITAAATP